MFDNQKHASESPGAHLSEYMHGVKFLGGEEEGLGVQNHCTN